MRGCREASSGRATARRLIRRLSIWPSHRVDAIGTIRTSAGDARSALVAGRARAGHIAEVGSRWRVSPGNCASWPASAGKAFLTLMEPHRLMFLALGCMMGLVLGIVPGIGGLAGTAMLLPFTFGMDPYSAFALLLGLGATTATGDPIPAILFGVPGGAASAATVLDGFPMAKKGEAGRALSAAYMSSMMGGMFGAMLLAVSHPDPAAGDALSRLAGAAGVFRARAYRWWPSCPATRRCAASPPAASAS